MAEILSISALVVDPHVPLPDLVKQAHMVSISVAEMASRMSSGHIEYQPGDEICHALDYLAEQAKKLIGEADRRLEIEGGRRD